MSESVCARASVQVKMYTMLRNGVECVCQLYRKIEFKFSLLNITKSCDVALNKLINVIKFHRE